MPSPFVSAAAKGWLLMVVGGAGWGACFSLAKIATDLGAHPLGINWWQGTLGGILLLLFNIVRRVPVPLDRDHLVFYVVCGLLGTALPGTMFFYAANHIPAGVLSIVIALVPMMSFAVSAALGFDRITALRLFGVALGLVAIIMMTVPEASLPDRAMVPWLLLAVAAAACYAAENNFIALRKPAATSSITLLCGMLLLAALVMTPLVLVTGTFVTLTSPFGKIELCVVGIAVINVVCYGMFVHLVAFAGPVFASQTGYIVTISGVFWGIVIFGEQHSAWIWGALMVMLVGLTLVKPLGQSAEPGLSAR